MFANSKRIAGAARAGLIIFAFLSLTACGAVYRNHGYVPTPSELAQVEVGKDTRESVVRLIGEPGTSGVLDDSGYYYISSRFRQFGPMAPKVVDRQLVAISFNNAGVVQNIERFGLEHGRAISLDRRVTETGVEDRTLLRQLLRNLGRFNPASVLQ
ncbi:outer membrane protein assembly factor BamE [Pontibaca methylaminivorans]|uniref:Beta-barrel assembly machine subunit BamE n=1 Tax=Pontibaca methylaminivorans TaxID=515897 RepID=A0A1R3X2L5_9RHOB|nr:outer membrane protein assembly factor BamE [Pontibaca methylaminivorans]SIT85210.1 Beta-barrel assembly machine subunit BamE [Pontibaca methylaminivorans]